MKRTAFQSIIAGILVFVVTVLAEAANPNDRRAVKPSAFRINPGRTTIPPCFAI